jgi:hypothetical protein
MGAGRVAEQQCAADNGCTDADAAQNLAGALGLGRGRRGDRRYAQRSGHRKCDESFFHG